MKYLKFAFVFYAIFMAVIMVVKPRIIFDQDGNPKKFGTGSGSHKTILPLWFVTIIGAIFSYVSALLLFYQTNNNVDVSPNYQFGVNTQPHMIPNNNPNNSNSNNSNSNNYIRTSNIPIQSNYQWGLKKNYQSGGGMNNVNVNHSQSQFPINHANHIISNRSYPSGEYYQNYHPIDWNQSW